MADRCVALLRKKILQLHSHMSRLSYPCVPSFLPGTLPESFASEEEDRRLRLVTDEVTRPGRFRPRVPLPLLTSGACWTST